MAHKEYELLKERALIHFETLLTLWNIEFQIVGDHEYDFLSTTRPDSSFGAVRFSVAKGIGSDFAGTRYSKSEYERVGMGFSREDFDGFGAYGETNPNFDAIGLTQRIHNLNSYSEAAKRLKADLDKIDGGKVDTAYLAGQVALRHAQIEVKREKIRAISSRMWSYCRDIKGTIGETYLQSRNIHMQDYDIELNMKFNNKVFNSELKMYIPAVLFKVSDKPDGELKAIHRVWIARDGTRKARLQESKMALGSIQGCGIWFGTPCETLYVCEGPEEALIVKYEAEKQFTVSTVYANNYHNLKIPEYVVTVVLVPDMDEAGLQACAKAEREYKKQGKKVKKVLRGTNG